MGNLLTKTLFDPETMTRSEDQKDYTTRMKDKIKDARAAGRKGKIKYSEVNFIRQWVSFYKEQQDDGC